MPLTRDEFLKRATDCGLMTIDAVAAIVAGFPADAPSQDGEQLARELVRQNKLTKFQAEQIYSGKGKSLTLGNYVILDKLGQGGMGMVLKAEHKRMKRVVAIKVMSGAALKSRDAVKRFHREVEAAAKLSHPNIVAAFDADEAGGTHFLVMEFVAGSDLAQIVKQGGPQSVAKALDYTLQAARGLEHAHQQGLVHRDIKPANLLLDQKGTVKILDMGLARFDDALSSSPGPVREGLTTTGTIMGTVDYMSPEQALDTKHADARSDIYSLGISLYYLLAGRVVFEADTIMKKLLAHRDQQIPSLCAIRPEVSPELDAVFQKMIAKNPADRFQTMPEVIAALQACVAGGNGGGIPTATVVLSANPSPSNNAGDTQFRNFLQDLSDRTTGGRTIDRSDTTNQPRDKPSPATMTEAMPARRQKPSRGPKPPVGLRPTKPMAAGIGAVVLAATVIFLFWPPGRDRGKPSDPVPNLVSPVKGSTEATLATASLSPANYALEFDGKASYVEIPTLGSRDFGPLTVEAWVNADPALRVTSPIIALNGPYWVQLNRSGRGNWYAIDRDQNSMHTETTPAGRWFHLAFVLGSKTGQFFVDGHEVARGLRPDATTEHGSSPFGWIGGAKDSKTPDKFHVFNGMIDEVRISKVARYDKDFTPDVRFTSDKDTLALYHFDEGQGSELNDSSGNNHHGKIVGAKWVKIEASPSQPPNAKPVDEAWLKMVRSLPPEERVAKVMEKLKELNPEMNSRDIHKDIKDGQVTSLALLGVAARDLSPLQALSGLKKLVLNVPFGHERPADLAGLKGLQLSWLEIYNTQVRDLSPLAGMPLTRLEFRNCPVTDISVLKTMPTLNDVLLNFDAKRDTDVLRSLTSLQKINDKPVAEFWKSVGDPAKTFTNAVGMEFVRVPKGKSWLGGGGGKPGTQEVTIPDDFYLGKYEVTQDEWEKVMGKNPSGFSRVGTNKESVKDISDADLKRFPIEWISWEDTQTFVKRINESSKEAGWVYRLPTESEWEYACRGGPMADQSESAFDFYLEKAANQLLPTQANFKKHLNRTTSVGAYPPNRLGLCDMHGNVWELCEDLQTSKDGAAHLVSRGGCWNLDPGHERAANRLTGPPSNRYDSLGLRLARVPVVSQAKFTNSLGMEFVGVPKGKSWLGGGGGKPGDRPIEFKEDFFLGRFEVTQEEWTKVTGKNPSAYSRTGSNKDLVKGFSDDVLRRYPVESVSWDAAQEFIRLLNEQAPEPGWTYRLPKEVEWEYACRGGPMNDAAESGFDFYLAKPTNELLAGQANFGKLYNRPTGVGAHAPNRLGLCDMHGNVWEWCDDRTDDKVGGPQRVHCGGGWHDPASGCRATSRYPNSPTTATGVHGLRVARVPFGNHVGVLLPPFDILTSPDYEWSAPENLGAVVNSAAGEGSPCLSADGLTLLFDSDRPGGQGKSDLWMSRRPTLSAPWSAPENLGATVNSSENEKVPTLSSDGLALLFATDRGQSDRRYKLRWCHRKTTAEPWSTPTTQQLEVTAAAGVSDYEPELAADGLSLLFTSFPRGGAHGLEDLWQCRRPTKTDPWGPVQNLGAVVNGSAKDMGPALSSDGRVLVFASDRPGGQGKVDFWWSSRPSLDAPWSAPQNLGKPVNSEIDELSPTLSADGQTLLYRSNRPGGRGGNDLWMSRRVRKSK